jgi:hypothetical protein
LTGLAALVLATLMLLALTVLATLARLLRLLAGFLLPTLVLPALVLVTLVLAALARLLRLLVGLLTRLIALLLVAVGVLRILTHFISPRSDPPAKTSNPRPSFPPRRDEHHDLFGTIGCRETYD